MRCIGAQALQGHKKIDILENFEWKSMLKLNSLYILALGRSQTSYATAFRRKTVPAWPKTVQYRWNFFFVWTEFFKVEWSSYMKRRCILDIFMVSLSICNFFIQNKRNGAASFGYYCFLHWSLMVQSFQNNFETFGLNKFFATKSIFKLFLFHCTE